MTRSTQTKSPSKDQFREFRKAARDLGCEPDEKRFQDTLRKVAKHKPSEGAEGKKPRAGRRHD